MSGLSAEDKVKSVESAKDNWNKAVDALFDLDKRVKQERVSEREILFELSGVVSHLVVSVGSLVVIEAGQQVDAP